MQFCSVEFSVIHSMSFTAFPLQLPAPCATDVHGKSHKTTPMGVYGCTLNTLFSSKSNTLGHGRRAWRGRAVWVHQHSINAVKTLLTHLQLSPPLTAELTAEKTCQNKRKYTHKQTHKPRESYSFLAIVIHSRRMGSYKNKQNGLGNEPVKAFKLHSFHTDDKFKKKNWVKRKNFWLGIYRQVWTCPELALIRLKKKKQKQSSLTHKAGDSSWNYRSISDAR